MKRSFLVFTLVFCVLSLGAAPAAVQTPAQNQPQAQNDHKAAKPKTAAKGYSFAEELIDLPIKPFEIQKLSDSELISINPQALKAYENAAALENNPNVFENPNAVGKAWTEVAKITVNNPFLNTANSRIEEWKKVIEIFKAHKDNVDKIKTLLASSILTNEQKKGVLLKHLDDFGITFGTQEIFDLTKNTNGFDTVLKGTDFQAKIKDIKRARCEKKSGRDCFECGRNYTDIAYEKLTFFTKACDMKYQPGCEEVNKIKAEQEAEKARIAAEERRKAEEFATKSYNLTEEPIDLIKPFVLGTVNEQDVLNASPAVLKKFEAAVAKEKEKESIKTPGAMTVMWEEIAKITDKNPFQQIAQARGAQWRECAEKMERHENSTNQIKKNIPENTVSLEQKIYLTLKHLDEYGLIFGALEVANAVTYSNEIANYDAVKTKIKDVRLQRCNLNSASDCHTFAMNHAVNEFDKKAYLKKACDLGRMEACSGQPAPVVAAPAPAQQPVTQQAAEPEKKEPEKKAEPTEEDKFKKELWDAGKRTRIAVATTTLVAGVVVGVLGGVSLYGASKYKKDRDKWGHYYEQSETQEDMDKYRKKTTDAHNKMNKYNTLGGVGLGLGAALIATGITFYCIEFKGEKEVRKKYNVSFGASPFDGTLQFAINW